MGLENKKSLYDLTDRGNVGVATQFNGPSTGKYYREAESNDPGMSPFTYSGNLPTDSDANPIQNDQMVAMLDRGIGTTRFVDGVYGSVNPAQSQTHLGPTGNDDLDLEGQIKWPNISTTQDLRSSTIPPFSSGQGYKYNHDDPYARF